MNAKIIILNLLLFISTQVYAQMSYAELQRAYRECCTPDSYNEYAVPLSGIRPQLVQNTNKCTPKAANTEFLWSDEVLYKTLTYSFKQYYVKFSASRADEMKGGKPDGAWRLHEDYKLGNYVAAYGYAADMYGPYNDEASAALQKTLLEDIGYCDIRIIEVVYKGQIKVELAKVGGYYVGP